jgi:hypothetical protein
MKKLLAIGLVLLTTSAWADWVFIGANDLGDTFYVDPATKKTGKNPRVWILTVNGGGYPEDRVYRSTKVLREADCNEGKLRGLSYHWYKGADGTDLIKSENSAQDWSYPAPGSVLEAMYVYLCGKAP